MYGPVKEKYNLKFWFSSGISKKFYPLCVYMFPFRHNFFQKFPPPSFFAWKYEYKEIETVFISTRPRLFRVFKKKPTKHKLTLKKCRLKTILGCIHSQRNYSQMVIYGESLILTSIIMIHTSKAFIISKFSV